MSPIIFPCTNPAWKADREAAKELDRYAVRAHGQRDRDHHLCAEQRSQARRGYMVAIIFQNIYGYCVRDTMNDGLGNMSGNFSTHAEALEWARVWHSRAPDRREVRDWTVEEVAA